MKNIDNYFVGVVFPLNTKILGEFYFLRSYF